MEVLPAGADRTALFPHLNTTDRGEYFDSDKAACPNVAFGARFPLGLFWPKLIGAIAPKKCCDWRTRGRSGAGFQTMPLPEWTTLSSLPLRRLNLEFSSRVTLIIANVQNLSSKNQKTPAFAGLLVSFLIN